MKDDLFFEQFLKEKVDNLRLRPSDRVWNSVISKLKNGYSPRFNYALIFLWMSIFLNIYLSTNQSGFFFKAKAFIGNDIEYSNDLASGNNPENNLIKSKPLSSNRFINDSAGILLSEKKEDLSKITKSDSDAEQLLTIQYSNNTKLVSVMPSMPSNEIKKINHLPYVLSTNNLKIADNNQNLVSFDSFPKTEHKLIEKLKQKFKLNKNNKSLAFYFTPSLSYRVLYINNKPYFGNNGMDPESSVSHYPATGLEAGLAILKPISKRWKFRAGVQLNFSRYNINASKSNAELVYVSTSQNSGFSWLTNIRNRYGGNSSKKLLNENLQISIPVGLEYRMSGNDRFSMNMAATIQPSFSIYAGGYMITTNYKNYINADHLFRRYNIQTGVEVFAKAKLDILDIQIGPQIRYQVLSNTIGSYPIQEHLIDYGFKIGIIKKIE
jgi:hypothetical protein